MMFLSKRIVPSTPPSLVKLTFKARSSVIGVFVSTPIRDQVPELMYAHDSPCAGTAATAAAVACVAGAITGIGAMPAFDVTLGRNGPSTVPGWISVPRTLSGRAKAFTSSCAHVRVCGLIIWLVEALVYSL